MARYMEDASKLREQVDSFIDRHFSDNPTLAEVVVDLGHIINSAVLCNPRKPQGTVRRNIVQEALRGRCDVMMTKESYTRRDGSTGTFNKIRIQAK